MRAHLVQMDIVWEKPEENFRLVRSMLGGAGGAGVRAGDLVVLPEMFDTGFSLNVEATADRGATLEFLVGLARELKATVHGARTVLSPGAAKAHNRATVVGPDGRVLQEFAKVHPFSYGREPERFEGGGEVAVYEWRGGDAALKVGAAVCYDLRFPELFRLGLLRGAQAFALGANWPAARQHHWRALLIARAIENQAFVLGVNRTGDDPHLHYTGGSIAVGPRGDVLGELGEAAGVLSVEIDPREVIAWREKFPAWRDVKLIGGPGA